MKKLPLYVALDVDDREQALFIVRETAPYVEGFKIGPRLLLRYGTSLIPKIKPSGKIFLDLKFLIFPPLCFPPSNPLLTWVRIW